MLEQQLELLIGEGFECSWDGHLSERLEKVVNALKLEPRVGARLLGGERDDGPPAFLFIGDGPGSHGCEHYTGVSTSRTARRQTTVRMAKLPLLGKDELITVHDEGDGVPADGAGDRSLAGEIHQLNGRPGNGIRTRFSRCISCDGNVARRVRDSRPEGQR